uniref:hypothetical protein n=1 Tax=Pedobacter sp. L105 TaxID=1641871 RepID=UPI00131B5A76
ATTNEISSYITANFELSLPGVTVYGNSDNAYQDAGNQISKSQSEALNQAGLGGGNGSGNSSVNSEGVNLNSSFVSVTFDPGANRLVDPKLEKYFSTLMQKEHNEVGVNSINISSTTNHPTNALKSAHRYGGAFDINYINGVHISNNQHSSIYSVISDFQDVIQFTPGWLENYGPVNDERMVDGKSTYWPYVKQQHQNHIHISIPQ